MSFRLCLFALVSRSLTAAIPENVTIYKIDYPVQGLCGQEQNVTKSDLNPHYFFPVHFGGFLEGTCADAGYTIFKGTKEVEMHPVPGVHHNLTFELYANPVPGLHMILVKDPNRKNRTVTAKLCIPPDAQEGLALYVFGHGFDCKPEDYNYFCSVAATVMVYETNRSFIDFNTYDLALDQVFLSSELPRLAKEDPTSLLYKKLGGPVILGGHSMGGGTAILAGARGSAATGMALFAPGMYTIPVATPSLKHITVPTMIVSGSDDCGPNQLPKEAQPAYDGLASEYKVLVVLKGANHCGWTQPLPGEKGVCTAEECHKIDAATQHRLGTELLKAFIGGVAGSWSDFEQKLAHGEVNGTWSFFSSKTSMPSKKLHNDCPCKSMNKAEATAESILV